MLGYLGNVDELDDDMRALLGRGFAEHHALHPLAEAVEERDRPLQAGVLVQVALDRVLLEVAELREWK